MIVLLDKLGFAYSRAWCF